MRYKIMRRWYLHRVQRYAPPFACGKLVSAVLMAAFACCIAHAAPFVPQDDAQVLERLAERTTPEYRALKALQTRSAQAPGELGPALALANAHVRMARQEGDPRYLGYAQAALAPWWRDREAPTPVLVLRATIRQSLHDFDAATRDLDTALSRESSNAQALLTRATVLTVQGKYGEARDDCTRLGAAARPIYAVLCVSSIEAVTGKGRQASQLITRAFATLPALDAASREYGETMQGEIAHRLDEPDAERHFKAALELDPGDLYLLGAYCDWLLDHARPADVVPLVIRYARVDPLVLRLAIAQQMMQAPDAAATIATLQARFDASRARGDTVHRREEARFELKLKRNPAAALRLARENWRVQREPADLRILAEAAAAMNDGDALQTVRRWLADNRLEYPRVAALTEPARVVAGAK